MKTVWLVALALALIPASLAQADEKISQMPSASIPLTGAELVPLVQAGTNVQTPIANIYSAPTVLNNAALEAATTARYPNGVTRVGFAAANDGGGMVYFPSPSACPLNAGAGDNGSQVKSLDGKCWVWSPPPSGVTAMVFGAAGTGVADDTVPMQSAITAAAAAGTPLLFDTVHLYEITSSLNISAPLEMRGPFRYGIWAVNQPSGSGPRNCPWGLVTKNTGITMINALAVAGTIHGVCIDMTGNDTEQAAAGAAIALAPPSTTTYQSGWTVEHNTILYPYDGITVNGSGYSSGCCGEGTTADGNLIAQNTIVDPADIGISNGKNTAGGATSGNTYRDNAIVCGSLGLARGVGFALYDGDVDYDGTTNGPEGCGVGSEIIPGTVSSNGQNAGGNFKGVLGDQSTTHDLLVEPGSGGHVEFLNFNPGSWASATGNVNSALINCNTSGGECNEIEFNGFTAHGGNGQAQPIMDIEGSANGPFDLTIIGSTFCDFGTPTTGAVALTINIPGGGGRYVVNGNRLGAGCSGSYMPTGISLAITGTSSPYAAITITGNDISSATTPISYTPNATDHVILKDNMGIDDQVGSIASATTITVPASYPVDAITGTTTVKTIDGGWANRQVEFIPTGAVPFATGGNICNAITATANVPIYATYNVGGGCWNLK